MTNKIPDEIIEAMLAEIKPDGLPADASDIRAALAAAEAMGWKLVPRETTPDMHFAGIAAFQKPENQHGAVLDEAFAAMYDAAPTVKP